MHSLVESATKEIVKEINKAYDSIVSEMLKQCGIDMNYLYEHVSEFKRYVSICGFPITREYFEFNGMDLFVIEKEFSDNKYEYRASKLIIGTIQDYGY